MSPVHLASTVLRGPERIPKILTFVDYYLPGYKAGGPLRAVSNLVEAIGDRVNFRVVTRDRDRDDETPFPNVRLGEWQRVGKADVLYLPVNAIDTAAISPLLDDADHEVVFLNSLFSPVTRRVLGLTRRSRNPSRKIVLAPRGECAASALGQKPYKKWAFLALARVLGLYEGLMWLSSSAHESDDIRRMWKRLNVRGTVQEIPELPMHIETGIETQTTKQAGRLKAAFLGRIVSVKNLLGTLDLLNGVQGDITFTIYGPKEDSAYWTLCEARIRALPANITAVYGGAIPHEQVSAVLKRQHLLIAQSLGENYGHSIAEALSVGCPVLTSDQTPWRGLEAAGAGWDIAVSDTTRARSAISRMVALNSEEHALMQKRAVAYARERTDYEGIAKRNLDFFCELLFSRSPTF